MLHQHVDILKVFSEYRRRTLAAKIGGNRPGNRLAAFNIELGAVHGASEIFPVKCAHLKRRIHMAAFSLYGMEPSAGIANDYFVSIEFHAFHSAGRDFNGVYRLNKSFTQGPPPLATVAEAHRDQAHRYARKVRTNIV